ncbi:MAG: DUF7674 family protein [Sciscionella sp.]
MTANCPASGGASTVDWQAKAAELLPELAVVVDAGWSVHVLFTELLDLVRQAHAHGDEAALRRGYAFAHWCLRAQGRFLANAALVSFYELLFDDWGHREQVAGWLPPEIIERVRPLWEWRLSAAHLAEVDRLLAPRGVGAARCGHPAPHRPPVRDL